jgi:hypothetical protein
VTEPLFTPPPVLTERQQAAYDLIAASDGVDAGTIGSNWHALRGKHAADARCDYCDTDGRDVVRSKALAPLVTYRRTPHGNLYVLRGAKLATEPAVRDGSQLTELPGETFEDIFTTGGRVSGDGVTMASQAAQPDSGGEAAVTTAGKAFQVRTLRDLRNEAGMALAGLEQATGINRGHLSEIERGIRLATYAQITELAAALDLAPEDFELRCVLVHEERA